MMKVFGYDGPFARTMSRVFDMVLLHILWVMTSLPVLTIGASTTALFTITLKMVKNEEPYILKGYMKAFKESMKKSTILWMIMAVVFMWIFFILRICMKGDLQVFGIIGIANAAMLVVAFLAALYVFPIQAIFENSVTNILKNAVICSLRYLPYSLVMAGVVLVPVLVTGYVQGLFPVMIALWLFSGSSLIALGISYVIKPVFDKVSS